MNWLLDGNVLVALVIGSHLHHGRAHRWFNKLPQRDRFVVCSVTQGTLLRTHLATSPQPSAAKAWEALRMVAAHPRFQWWGEDLDYLEVPHDRVQGSKQVTDAWLATLARRKGGRLATLDRSLSRLYPDTTVLLPE